MASTICWRTAANRAWLNSVKYCGKFSVELRPTARPSITQASGSPCSRLSFALCPQRLDTLGRGQTHGVGQRPAESIGDPRWLPAIVLDDHGPTLLGVAVERNGACAWHVYDDLGDRSL